MKLDPRTPIIVGAGVQSQRCEKAAEGKEAYQLMVDAVVKAAQDAGSEDLLSLTQLILVPKGLWSYQDAGRLVADAIEADKAKTLLADIGILQQTLFNVACTSIQDGRHDIVIVTGAEAKYRSLRAQIEGVELVDTEQDAEVTPDTVLKPEDELWSQLEQDNGLGMPVTFYSLMENALRHAQGISIDSHRDNIARLWEAYNKVARDNKDAWSQEAFSAEQIRNASDKNKMLAFPYAKLHNSQWNVDQAAGLIFCSVAAAQQHGIAREKWIFPWSGTESNHMASVCNRKQMYRCPGAEIAGREALRLAETTVDELDFVDLYSCFPLAPRIYGPALGLDPQCSPTYTGGMSFAGGPLNNYVLQAGAKLVALLRSKPNSKGLVSSVSGMLTKQGFGIWGADPAPNGFQFADVSEQVSRDTQLCELVDDYTGPAIIAGYTVLYQQSIVQRAVVICDLPDGKRTVAHSEDPGLIQRMTEEEFCSRSVVILAEHLFELVG